MRLGLLAHARPSQDPEAAAGDEAVGRARSRARANGFSQFNRENACGIGGPKIAAVAVTLVGPAAAAAHAPAVVVVATATDAVAHDRAQPLSVPCEVCLWIGRRSGGRLCGLGCPSASAALPP